MTDRDDCSRRLNWNRRAWTQRVRLAACWMLAPLGVAHAQGLDWARSPSSGVWFAETPSAMNWSAAEAIAQRFGGNLATVRDSADNTWLDANFFSVVSPYRYHWIGLYQDTADPAYVEPSGGWKWSSGAPLAFANWSAGQPDDLGGGQNFGRTAGSTGGPSSQWFDESEIDASNFGSQNDLYLEPGALLVFNTSSSFVSLSQLQFVPGTDDVQFATPLGSVLVTDGVLALDDFYISAGATLKVEGPNPIVIMARGRVVIRGKLDCSGTSSQGVNTLNTTHIPEPGAPGQAGGGRGGTGSPLTTASSPSGGNGFGAFNRPDGGGRGGETGWSNLLADANRRGAGGGGGTLGENVIAPAGQPGSFWQARIGFDAEAGFSNLTASNGAIHGPGPAFGGAAGPRPFLDSDSTNDFYGTTVNANGNMIVGELIRPWAGAGGGGGGDAARVPSGTFPAPFSTTGDEKGAGGGGGGGSCQIMALDRIVFGANGQILARGGLGGGGENTSFLNRVGGGSGGGSGGHVVLQSAVHIDLRAKPGVLLTNANDQNWAVDVRGGQGGAGIGDLGGAIQSVNGQKESLPAQDACPPGYPTSGPNACRGHVDGAGGDGGPGIVQFHTPLGVIGTNPATADILVPVSMSIDRLSAPAPLFSAAPDGRRFAQNIGTGRGLLELDSADCDANGEPDRYEIVANPALDLDSDGLLDACDTTVTYCVGEPSPLGCTLNMSSSGIPSASAASGFDVIVSNANGQRSGGFFLGVAPASTSFFDNNLTCVATPFQRLGLSNSGGNAGQCDGEFRLDWNAWRAANPGGIGSPYAVGQMLYMQGWMREPQFFRGIALSSAHRFTLEL